MCGRCNNPHKPKWIADCSDSSSDGTVIMPTGNKQEMLELQGMLAEQNTGLETLKHNNSEYDAVEQELTLRYEIGALTDEEFNAEMEELKSSMQDYSVQLDGYTDAINQLELALAKWEGASGESISIHERILQLPRERPSAG